MVEFWECLSPFAQGVTGLVTGILGLCVGSFILGQPAYWIFYGDPPRDNLREYFSVSWALGIVTALVCAILYALYDIVTCLILSM